MLELLSLLTFVLIFWTAIFNFPASSNVHLLLEVVFMQTEGVALMIGWSMVFVQVERPNVLMCANKCVSSHLLRSTHLK